MTDPNVGFSIYISDREREKLEMERRRAQKNNDAKPQPSAPVSAAPVVLAASAPPLEITQQVEELHIEPKDEEEADIEAILAAQITLPILTVSNVTDDDTPWKAKQLQKEMADRKSLCDNCNRCGGYEPRSVKGAVDSGSCKSCACDLIHHLKSFESDEPRSDEEDYEEEEWEDDDDEDGDNGNDPNNRALQRDPNEDSESDGDMAEDVEGGESSY